VRFCLDNPFAPLYKIPNVYPDICEDNLKKSMHVENIPVVDENTNNLKDNNLTLRPMEMEDIDEIMDIEIESFSTPYSADFFIQYINKRSDYCGTMVAQRLENNIPVIAGYISIKIDHSDVMVVVSLAVASHSRRRGVGSLLMDYAINHGQNQHVYKIKLHVSVFNLPAQKLYSSKGFQHGKWLNNYYSSENEDAVLMERYFLED